MLKFGWLLFFFCTMVMPVAFAQDVSIELGKSPVPIDEYFTISATIKNQKLNTISKFPEIEGFKKSGRSSSTTTSITNGQVSTEQTVVQRYAAIREGTFIVKPFTIEINGQKAESPGGKVVIGPAGGQAGSTAPPPLQGFGLLDDLFGKQKPQEFIDKKEEAFLAFTTSKSKVFVGEGVHVDLSFYVASADQHLLDFHRFNQQHPAIIKLLKPDNVWEENFELTDVEPEAVSIDGKGYLRFRLYEAVYFPINAQPLLFPSVGLQMIKYKFAKDPGFFGENRMADTKMFYTAPKIVEVKPLPEHPLRDAVPVGTFTLNEGVDRAKFIIGKSFNYLFEISGEGNLSAIAAPAPAPTPGLEFTNPDVRQNIRRQNGTITGTKSFKYFVTPKKPGNYSFSQGFSFIFFNPETAKYDTLQADLVVKATGEEDNNATIQEKDLGEFYQRIPNESNALVSLNQVSNVKFYTNLVLFFLLMLTVYLFYKHRL